MFGSYLEKVRESTPLVHCITNYVTVNDVANVLLACGGSPIMSDDIDEVQEITAICGGLDLNIGTLDRRTIASMLAAGRRATELGHPIVLDPVGAGASELRTETAHRLMDGLAITVVRGNISEIKALAMGTGTTRGVDADVADAVTEENLAGAVAFARTFAEHAGSIVAISGAIDIVADAHRAFVIRNGHPLMAGITGSGCMLTAVLTAFETAVPEHPLEAAAAAVAAFGVAGQIAAAGMRPGQGNASYRTALIDAVCNLTPAQLEDNEACTEL